MKTSKRIFSIVLSGIICALISVSMMTSAVAADSTSVRYYTPPTDNTIQYKYTTIKKSPVWTATKTLDGQYPKGTKCSKGDRLGYYSNTGTNVTVSASIGYGIGSVGVSVPLGQARGKVSGVTHSMLVTKPGYYLLQNKKEVQLTVVLVQTRRKNAYTNKWSDWSSAKVSSKTYTTLRDAPSLKYVSA